MKNNLEDLIATLSADSDHAHELNDDWIPEQLSCGASNGLVRALSKVVKQNRLAEVGG